MLAAALTAIGAVLGAAAVPPPGQPLDVAVVDESGFPTVVVDVVVPAPLSGVEITPDMVSIDGVAVDSLAPVDPTTTALALVIDDRPTIDDQTVEAAQGASVELARNLDDGAQFALFTPSGLRSALTADRGATIARISGITAGAPDVVPLPELLVDAATTLGQSTLPDRHLVVVLGGEVTLDDAQLTALRSSLSSSGTRVHAVAPNGPGPLLDLAAATGGLAPATTELVAAMDRITSAIDDRYRAVATVAATGGHEVAVEVEGNRFTAPIDVAPAAPDPTPPATAPASPPPRASSTATTLERTPVATTQPAGDEPAASPAPAGEVTGDDGSSLVLPAILAIVVLTAAGAGAFVLLRRRRTTDRPSVAPAAAPDRAADPAVDPEPVPAPLPVLTPAAASAAAPEAEPQLEIRPAIPPVVMMPPPPVVPAPGPPADERAPTRLASGKLRMRPSTGEVWSGNRRVELNQAERGVLELLLTQGGHGLTSESILEAAGLPPGEGREAADAIIATVRRKTGTTGRNQTMPRASDEAVLEDVTTDVTAVGCESNRSLNGRVERTGFSCEGSSSGPRQAYVHFRRSDADDTDYRISAQPVGGFPPSNFGWPALESGNRTPLAQVPWPGAEAGAPAATVSFFVIDENNNRAVLHDRLTWGDVLAAPGCAAIFA